MSSQNTLKDRSQAATGNIDFTVSLIRDSACIADALKITRDELKLIGGLG
jgi:hypothetical protein